jgi:hypothetical protein
MTNPFNFPSLLESVAERMDAEMREARFAGPTVEIGVRREEILIDFLRRYLPRRYFVGTGVVVSPKGRSLQQDIVVFDEANYQRIPQTAVGSIFPHEGVRGMIQVKSNLTKTDLTKGINNLLSAKALFKKHKFHPFAVIFAYTCSSPELRRRDLEQLNSIYSPGNLVVDRVYTPGRPTMIYFDKKNNSRRHANEGNELRNRDFGKATMLHFYRYLLNCLSEPHGENFNINNYVSESYFPEAKEAATRASGS